MTTCVSCGSSIPDGQGRSCSMCYGDIDYGRDGYYRRWLEEGEAEEAHQSQDEEDERETRP